jgi:hypothetical protein
VFLSLVDGESVDNVVEGAPEVEEAITEQDRPAPDIGWDFVAKTEQVNQAISLALSRDGERVTITPPVGLSVERLKVLVRPSDLGAAARRQRLLDMQWRMGGHNRESRHGEAQEAN